MAENRRQKVPKSDFQSQLFDDKDCSSKFRSTALSSYKDHPYKDQVVHFRKNKDQY